MHQARVLAMYPLGLRSKPPRADAVWEQSKTRSRWIAKSSGRAADLAIRGEQPYHTSHPRGRGVGAEDPLPLDCHIQR